MRSMVAFLRAERVVSTRFEHSSLDTSPGQRATQIRQMSAAIRCPESFASHYPRSAVFIFNEQIREMMRTPLCLSARTPRVGYRARVINPMRAGEEWGQADIQTGALALVVKDGNPRPYFGGGRVERRYVAPRPKSHLGAFSFLGAF